MLGLMVEVTGEATIGGIFKVTAGVTVDVTSHVIVKVTFFYFTLKDND